MPSTEYALMVGINAYPPPIPPLQGCVNDIRALEAVLRERTSAPNLRFDSLVLLNEQATRQAVIDGFMNHLCKAGPEDVALFCYAGHGSQERTPPEFWYIEPDRLDETIVCFDSRTPGHYDLADKELSKLIAQVARRDPHILVVLDSCHSGSGTRDISAAGVRRVPSDARARPLGTFLVTPDEAAALGGNGRAATASKGWIILPKGRHVVMSACQDNEEAREVRIDNQVRGVFTHFLLEAIQHATGMPTYRDLFKRVNALVRTRVAGQSPLIEATELEDLDRPFLGGNIIEHKPYYTVSFHATDGWVIDAGAMHGIAPREGEETTYLALFPVEASDHCRERAQHRRHSCGTIAQCGSP